ncbi:MAG: radical SAM protein [Gemmatimonadaceae bacterium]
MKQIPLFGESYERAARQLPVVGEQKDIRYVATTVSTVLNTPAATGMSYWSLNPYIGCAFGCAYCYARYAHGYAMERAAASDRLDVALRHDARTMPPWLAFERRVFVKRNAAAVLRRSLRNGSRRHEALATGETIVIGTATDPYQPAERRFQVMRSILEVLAEHAGLSIVIITKSPLVTRDIDLLTRIARQSRLGVHISLITLDRALARRIEPRAPTPESRVRALARLRGAGIDAGVNVMPVLPGITDDPRALDALVGRVAEAGASYVSACALRLQYTARKRYLPFIAEEFPELTASYRVAYGNGHQVGERYRAGLETFLRARCRRHGVRFGGRTGDDLQVEPTAPEAGQLLLI